MEFLNGILIGGVALAGVPVLIHLLNRRRYRETIWAAMEFLREAVKRHATRLRLEDVLLMALRMLVVALVALALARPTLTGRWTGMLGLARKSSTAAIIILDNSYSMGATHGTHGDTMQNRVPIFPSRPVSGTSCFDGARDLARRIVATLPRGAGSTAAVLLVNDRVEPIVGRLSQDLGAVDQAFPRARLSDGGTDFAAALKVVRDTLLPQVKAARTEVHILTDGQRRPWQQGTERLAPILADIARQATILIETVPPVTTENLALTTLGVPGLASTDRKTQDILPSVHTACTVQAAVRNFGARAQESVPVDLWLDGKVVDRGIIPRLEAGAEERLVFRTRIGTAGAHRVWAELTPEPNDRLAPDNIRWLSLYVYDQVRVLVVDGDPRTGPFESESDYLRLALSPVDLDAPDAPFLVTTDVRTLEELEGVRLADYSVAVLANVAGVSQMLASRLARFVGDGGGLIVFLGDQVDLRDYNDILFAEGKGLLPARLQRLIGDPHDDSQSFGVMTGNLTHYLVNHYEPTDPTLSRVQVNAAIAVDPSGVPDTEVVLRYTNGQPFVLARRHGLGHVILLTTSADADWTNLPTKPALLPLMQRSVNYLVFGQRAPERLNLRPGQPFLFSLRPDQARLQVKITDPEGSPRAFPGQAGRRRIEWTETWRAGFYRMELAAGDSPDRTGQVPAAELPPEYFCVNLDTAESDLTPIDEGALRSALAGVPFTFVEDAGADLTASLRRQRLGTELWPYLLGLVLLLLLGEGVLARALSLRGT